MKNTERKSLLLTLLLLWFAALEQPIMANPATDNQHPLPTSSDSLLVQQLRKKGIQFSNNNSVTLLTNGQEKFDDLFKAI